MRFAAAAITLMAIASGTDAVLAQGMILTIEIQRSNPEPHRPATPIDNLQQLMAAFAGCWNPPPAGPNRQPVDLTFQVSFKRSGELFGRPRAVNFAHPVTQEERDRYFTAVAEAVDRCSRMPFTELDGRSGRGPHVSGQLSRSPQHQEGRGIMADNEKLTLETTKGNVVIELRPDLAPQACRAHQDAGERRLLRRHRVPSRDRRLHGADRMSERHRHRRIETIRTCLPNSIPSRTCAAPPRWRVRRTRTAPTASFSSASTTRASSTSSTPCGARSSKAWRTSTRSSAASRCQNPDKIVKATIG